MGGVASAASAAGEGEGEEVVLGSVLGSKYASPFATAGLAGVKMRVTLEAVLLRAVEFVGVWGPAVTSGGGEEVVEAVGAARRAHGQGEAVGVEEMLAVGKPVFMLSDSVYAVSNAAAVTAVGVAVIADVKLSSPMASSVSLPPSTSSPTDCKRDWEVADGVQSGWMTPVVGSYRNRCDSWAVVSFEHGMTVKGAGASGDGSKVAQYGSTLALEATKMGSLRFTPIGPEVPADVSVTFPSNGTR